MVKDKKFCLDPSFKFHVFNVLQKREVSLHTSLLIRRPSYCQSANSIDRLTHQDLLQILQAEENKTPVRDPNLQTLMNNLTSAGKHIRGSPYCKQGYRKEIFGLMIKFCMPPLWITISPAVVHSPIFLRLAGYEVDLTKITLADIPSAEERAKIVASDPVAAAKFFNLVIESFTSDLLGYNQSEGGIFGDPSAFYGCIEEQGTGTLHIHMLVWLKGFKTITDLESKLDDEIFRNARASYGMS